MILRNLFTMSVAAAVLAACGGDGGPDSAVSAASNQLVAEMNAQPVAGTTATSEAFDLVAGIGDTRRLVLRQDGSFSLHVLQSPFDLKDVSGSYSTVSEGPFKRFSARDSNGTDAFELSLDTRTRIIAGNVSWLGKAATAVGSGYAVPADLARLAGTYVFMRAEHNAIRLGADEASIGTLTIAANGRDVILCNEAQIDAAGNCQPLDGSLVPPAKASYTLVTKPDGLTYVTAAGATDFAFAGFLAGDRGPVLALDRLGQDADHILRAGAFYAVRQQALKGNESDGTWACADSGVTQGVFIANGSDLRMPGNTAETLKFNTLKVQPVQGFVTSTVTGTSFLPLSASLMVMKRDQANTLGVCHRTA